MEKPRTTELTESALPIVPEPAMPSSMQAELHGVTSTVRPRIDTMPPPADVQRTAASAVVSALVDAGVDTFFGLPGGPIMPFFDAILQEPRARLIESRHETSAFFAAMGYHRATGKVPGVVVTAGPGSTNVFTGLVAANLERVPTILVCGDVPSASTGGVLLQSIGPEGIGIDQAFATNARAVVRVARSSSAAPQAMAAHAAATSSARPGPAVLILPLDRGAHETRSLRYAAVPTKTAYDVDEAVAADVVEELCAARRPMIILGTGARPHAAAIRDFIEAIGVPFMTTPQAKGVISEAHSLSLRNGGLAASWWARRYSGDGADVSLVLGTDLDDVAVGPTPPVVEGGSLIHVDLNPNVFNRNHPTSFAIAGDVGAFARKATAVAAARGLRSRTAAPLLRRARERSPFDVPQFREDDSPLLAPHRVIHDLETAAGPGATYLTDIGEHMLFALHYLTARGPWGFVIHLGLGSMTSGICSAIGHALGGAPRVLCIAGDGGMQMAGSELLVAVKERVPVVFAVFNDARYNMVYHGYRQQFGRESEWSTPWIDFVAWARSFGANGVRIDRPGQISRPLLDELFAARLPAVLDIRHDSDIRIRGAGRVEALQHMSSAPPISIR
ncbi:MAG: thiamine pyrophosphate-binding protein [Polyangiaceae bacterium]